MATMPANFRREPTEFSTPEAIAIANSVIPLAGWRWFIDEDFAYLEPPSRGEILLREIDRLDRFTETYKISCVMRMTPNVGIYLRFKLGEG